MLCSYVLVVRVWRDVHCAVTPQCIQRTFSAMFLLLPVQHLDFPSQIMCRGVLHAWSKAAHIPAVCTTPVSASVLALLSCRCQALLRGLLGAIPVTSSGVNPLEDSYQLHVMFTFPCTSANSLSVISNTLLSSTFQGHFYLKR